MKTLSVKGDIISNDNGWVYDYLGIDYASPKLIEAGLSEANGDDVTVEINSGGGDVAAGSEIYTMLRKYSGNVTVQVVGLAASAASLIAMAGDTVEMSPAATMMIHRASTVVMGNRNDFKAAQDMLEAVDETIANAYVEKTGMSHDEALALMDSTYWITPQDAISKGFADKFMFEKDDDIPIAASLKTVGSTNKLKNLIKKSIAEDDSKQLAFLNAKMSYLKLGGKQYV